MTTPIRSQDVTIIPDDEVGIYDQLIINSKGEIKINKGRLILSWTVKECIGEAIINTKALAKLRRR